MPFETHLSDAELAEYRRKQTQLTEEEMEDLREQILADMKTNTNAQAKQPANVPTSESQLPPSFKFAAPLDDYMRSVRFQELDKVEKEKGAKEIESIMHGVHVKLGTIQPEVADNSHVLQKQEPMLTMNAVYHYIFE